MSMRSTCLLTLFSLASGTFSTPGFGAITLSEQSKLLAGDGQFLDLLGREAAISGDTVALAAVGDDDKGSNAGAVYVFKRTSGVWAQQAKLTASDGASFDGFGNSIAIDGDTLVVGAPGDDDAGSGSGSVYVFVRVGSSWSQQAKLTAIDGRANESFGGSIAFGSDTLAVGASSCSGAAAPTCSPGSVYMFSRTGGVWSQYAKLTAADATVNDQFGRSVALNGANLIVGADYDDDNGMNSGSAYVYSYGAGVWTQQAKLIASDGAASDGFGSAVTIENGLAIVGAVRADGNVSDSGAVYVFTSSGGVWSERAKLTASDGAAYDNFGGRVVVTGGTTILVSASSTSYAAADAGSVYIFTEIGGAWMQAAQLAASDAAAGDGFGTSIALNGNTLVIGAISDDDRADAGGSAYVFSVNDNQAPVADAGVDLAAAVGERVQLSGLLSTDPETPALGLTYQWTLVTAPSGSLATLENAGIAQTGFKADIPGDYVFSLVVTDPGGLSSPADQMTVTAEIDPAFVFERRASGLEVNRYRPYSREYSQDYFQSYGLVGGRPYGMGWRYSYSYDWSTGQYLTSYDYDRRVSWLDSSGEDTLVARGNPMPGLEGGAFEHVYLTGRSGTTLNFSGYGRNANGQYLSGDFRVEVDGTVTAAPRAPISIQGDTRQLQTVWRAGAWTDPSLVHGRTGQYTTQQRTVSYSCGSNNLQTCTYTYTDYIYQYGLYLLESAVAIRLVDTSTTVPDEQIQFRSFGSAARDADDGTLVFVGYWYDSTGRWRQGVFRRLSGGEVEKLLDDSAGPLKGGYVGRVAVDAGRVYVGLQGYSYAYGSNEGGSSWYSAWTSGIYRVSDGAIVPEVVGGSGSFYRRSPELYQYSYVYSQPNIWNVALSGDVLGFDAYSYFYTYDTSSQTYGYSQDQGIFWKENGQVRRIARGGDTLAGTQYHGINACCSGDWLKSRTAVLTGHNYTWTYASASDESTYTRNIDTILARFDSDRDERGDDVDNCPLRPNEDQLDSNANGIGDLCEDTDQDGWPDVDDFCPVKPSSQSDTDGDGAGDECDLCPLVNDDQSDLDDDDIGDVCDPDRDGDTFANEIDNCADTYNDQANLDTDVLGDACDPDVDGDGIANAVDGVWDGQNFADQSRLYSDEFSDHGLGGRSFGRIASRGQLRILVEDGPGTDEGLLISAVNGSGSGTVKQCDFQGRDANLRLEQGSVVAVTCGSLIVRALGRGGQIVLDDDVLIDVQGQSEARVVGLGEGEFRVENSGEVPVPLVVNLGEEIAVSIPVASATQVAEPEAGQYEIQTPLDSAQPVVAVMDGIQYVFEPGDMGVPVRIDIHPDSPDNVVNLNSGGVVPVAVLSSATFDATLLDPLTVSLASAPVKLKGKGTALSSIKDVNGDGRQDRIVHIETSALALSANSTGAVLKGMTSGGVAILGTDTVKVVRE